MTILVRGKDGEPSLANYASRFGALHTAERPTVSKPTYCSAAGVLSYCVEPGVSSCSLAICTGKRWKLMLTCIEKTMKPLQLSVMVTIRADCLLTLVSSLTTHNPRGFKSLIFALPFKIVGHCEWKAIALLLIPRKTLTVALVFFRSWLTTQSQKQRGWTH